MTPLRVRVSCLISVVPAALLAACGGHSAQSVVPSSPLQFQRVQIVGEAANSDVAVYRLGDSGANADEVNGVSLGADGNLYYALSPTATGTPYPTSGEIGSFNPTTHNQLFQTVAYMPAFPEETTHGVWIEELNNASDNPTIDRYSAINGSDTPISIPIGPFSGGFNGIGGGIAVGADGQLWWGSDVSPQVGEINQNTNAVKVYTLETPAGGNPPTPQFLISATDNNIWVTDADNDAVFRVVGTGASKGTNTYTILPQGPPVAPNYPVVEGITQGSDKKLYTGSVLFGSSPESGAFNRGAPAPSPTFTSIPLPAIGAYPYILAPVSGKVYANDFIWDALDVYDTASGALVILPLRTPNGASGIGGLAVDGTGTPWVGCAAKTSSGYTACLESVTLTSTWQVFPSTSIKLYTKSLSGAALPPGLIGIGETGSSGPFTVKSSDTAFCTASVISGFHHNIQVNPVKAGSCTLTITDAHSRSVNVAVKILSGKGSPDSRVGRPLRI